LFAEISNVDALEIFDISLGSITQSQNGDQTIWELSLSPSATYSLITLVDITKSRHADHYADTGYDSDGFDVGEFSVQAVPLPASVLMLLGALGGLGLIGHRRRAEA